MTPEEREYWLNAAKYGLPTDVYDRAAYPFTRTLAIPALGATIGPGREDYTGGGDLTRSPYIGSFAKDFRRKYYPEDPGAPFPLNSPLEEDPITVLRRKTDRARNYPRDFSEMFHPSQNPEGDIGRYVPNTPAVSRPNPPKSRPGMVIPQAPRMGDGPLPMSAVQAKSAAPAPGLLDTEEDQPADSKSWYDDPMRMGLLQAGLGLMSAPRYSTNPNDVTLSSALARGLGGFIQGYGGTKKRLDEAERQRIEDERDARKEEYDIMYLRALTTDAISRANSMNATMTEKAEARRLAGELKESQVRQILGKQTDLNQTQRVERRKQLMGMSPEMLQSEYLQFFPTAEMQETQKLREKLATYTGKPAETYAAYESKDLISAISKFEEPQKPESKPRGSQAERDEDILINATAGQANDPKVQMAFRRLFLEPSDETTQWNPQKQQTERFYTFPTIPPFFAEKFPELAQQQAQLRNQSSVVPAKQNLTEKQQQARADVLAKFEEEIISNNYDEPMDTFSFDEAMPFRRFQSDEYRMTIDAQDRWIENVLRAASGAAIAQSEYESYRQQYFPTPGEGPEAKERKRQMRALKVQEAQLKTAEQARKNQALPQVKEDPDDDLLK